VRQVTIKVAEVRLEDAFIGAIHNAPGMRISTPV
jgi:hypothetical protein